MSKAKKQIEKIDSMMAEAQIINEEMETMEKQLPSLEEIANSNRWFKSATPKQTLDWYIKWVASAMLLAGMSMRGIDGLQIYDLTISITGVILWLWVSILWKDRALIVVNSVGLLLLVRNLITMLNG